MKNPVKIIIAFFAIVFFLGIMVYFLGRGQLRKLEGVMSPEELFQIQSLSPEELLGTTKSENLNEFVSQDGDFKIKYPANWIEIKSEYQTKDSPKSYEIKYDLEYLLWAQKFTLKGEFAQLIIGLGNFEEEINFQQIINEMKESNQQQGWEMQIINLEANNNGASFEAKYQKPDHYALYSQEEIIFLQPREGKKKAYLVAIVAFEKDWQSFEREAEQIIDSVEINL